MRIDSLTMKLQIRVFEIGGGMMSNVPDICRRMRGEHLYDGAHCGCELGSVDCLIRPNPVIVLSAIEPGAGWLSIRRDYSHANVAGTFSKQVGTLRRDPVSCFVDEKIFRR
jgi:hypothetical protein